MLRQFTKKTKVFFNDPDHPQVVLTMKGYGKPFIEIQPSHIIRFRGKPGEELRSQVRFTSHLPGNFEITEFKTNIPQFIDVTVKAEEPGRIYVVEVRNKRQEAGQLCGSDRTFYHFGKASPPDHAGFWRAFPAFGGRPMIHNMGEGIETVAKPTA